MLKTLPNKGEVKRLLTVRRTRLKNKEREKVAEEEGGEEEMIRKGNAKTWNQPRLSRCRQTGQEERGLEQEYTRGGRRREEERQRLRRREKKRLEGSPRQGPLLRIGI